MFILLFSGILFLFCARLALLPLFFLLLFLFFVYCVRLALLLFFLSCFYFSASGLLVNHPHQTPISSRLTLWLRERTARLQLDAPPSLVWQVLSWVGHRHLRKKL